MSTNRHRHRRRHSREPPSSHPERFSRTFVEKQSQARRTVKTELSEISVHDLRHTHATAAAGWCPVKVVSERQGHARVMITLEIYAHGMLWMHAAAAATFAQIVGGGAS